MKKLKLLTWILLTGIIIQCTPSQRSSKNTDLQQVTLRQEWFPYSGYAGELVAANEVDSTFGIQIIIEAGSDLVDPIKLVQSGANDFGVASADRILTANEKGANLVAIGVINYVSPTCFISLTKNQLTSPNDLENKVVGVLTGTNTEYVYKALKSRFSLDENAIVEKEIPFDLGSFISGSYDIRPAFIYDEPVSLDMRNIEYEILEPREFGVNFIGTVYFTTQETIDNEPEVVSAFINSLKIGWERAIENPEVAISYLAQYDSGISYERELASFLKGAEYFSGENGKILFASRARWEEMAQILIDLDVLQDPTILERSVDLKFVSDK